MSEKDCPLDESHQAKHTQSKMARERSVGPCYITMFILITQRPERSAIPRSSDDATEGRLEAKAVAQLQAALDEKDKIIDEQERRIVGIENQKNQIIDEQGRIIKSLSHELTMTKLELIEAPVLGDDEVTEGWGTLDYKITQLIKRSYDYKAQKSVDPTALENVFNGLSEKHLLSLARNRLYLLKTYIWSFLTVHVFGPHGHMWAAKAHQSFYMLCFALEGMLDCDSLVPAWADFASRPPRLRVHHHEPRPH